MFSVYAGQEQVALEGLEVGQVQFGAGLEQPVGALGQVEAVCSQEVVEEQVELAAARDSFAQ